MRLKCITYEDKKHREKSIGKVLLAELDRCQHNSNTGKSFL